MDWVAIAAVTAAVAALAQAVLQGISLQKKALHCHK